MQRIPVWLRWTAVLAWMGVIFALSSQPNSHVMTEHVFHDLNYEARKLAHLTEYAILFLLSRFALGDAPSVVQAETKRAAVQRSIIAFLLCVFYASSDEWHQSFVPGRSPALTDVLIDSSGAAIACLIWNWRLKTRNC